MVKTGLKSIEDYFEYKDGWLYVDGERKGTPNKRGYVRVYYYRTPMYAHRIIFYLHHGYWPKVIDHIDRDKSNNLIDNLRDVTQSVNLRNQDDIKGYTWDKEHNKWRAQASKDNKQIYLGLFETEEQASNAYKEFIDGTS